MALVLTRRVNEKIVIKSRKTAEEIVLTVARIDLRAASVRLAIDADKSEWDILRSELIAKVGE